MKKLMIAAAVAAMTVGAYAGACDDVDVTDSWDDCLVYDVKIKAKTLMPKKLVCKDSCTKCSDVDPVYYLADASRTFEGYLWFCYDECWDVDDTPYIAMWEKKTKTAIIPLYYAIEGTKVVAYPVETEFDFLGRYNKKADKVAALWIVDNLYGWFYCAGVKGSVTKDKEMGTVTLKSISGNAVGMLALATVEEARKCDLPAEFTAQIAGLCDCWEDWCEGDGEDADMVPVSGTWSLKYNKKLSTGAKSMLLVVPSYAQELEA